MGSPNYVIRKHGKSNFAPIGVVYAEVEVVVTVKVFQTGII